MTNATNTSTLTSEERRKIAEEKVQWEEECARRFEEAKAQWLKDTEGKTMLDLANEIDNAPPTPTMLEIAKKHKI